MRGARFTGILLIFIGGLLLLDQLDIFYTSGREIIIFLAFLIGFLFLRRGLIHEHRRGIFLGTFLLSCAVWLIAIELNFLANDEPVNVGMFILSLSLAFFVRFSFRPNKSLHLFIGIITGVTGGLILLTYFHYISVWKLEYILETYWPLVLILLGLTLLSDRYFFSVKNSH